MPVSSAAGGGYTDPGFGLGGGYPADLGYGYPTDSGYGYPADSGYGYPTDSGYGYPADAGYGYATEPAPAAGSGGVSVPANTIATAPPAAPAPVASQPIVLTNPKANQNAVAYVLADAHTYQMKPGEQQTLEPRTDGPWIIAFDRGDGSAPARYSLSEGTYEFVLSATGWELQQKRFTATIDNKLAIAFNYVIDGQAATVAAGQKQTHSGLYPLEVMFDRGDNGAPAKVALESGVYTVTVDAARQRLDLLASDKLAAVGK